MGFRVVLFFFNVVLVWVLWWFHPRGIPIGLLVRLGLRYRLLWLVVLGGGVWLENGNGHC